MDWYHNRKFHVKDVIIVFGDHPSEIRLSLGKILFYNNHPQSLKLNSDSSANLTSKTANFQSASSVLSLGNRKVLTFIKWFHIYFYFILCSVAFSCRRSIGSRIRPGNIDTNCFVLEKGVSIQLKENKLYSSIKTECDIAVESLQFTFHFNARIQFRSFLQDQFVPGSDQRSDHDNWKQ
jgi:hypothetical protein